MLHVLVLKKDVVGFNNHHYIVDSNYNYNVKDGYFMIDTEECTNYIPMSNIDMIRIYDDDQWKVKEEKKAEAVRKLNAKYGWLYTDTDATYYNESEVKDHVEND